MTASLAPASTPAASPAASPARARPDGAPRVALVAGTLGQGGAEKQLVYAARALADAGVGVRVYSLTEGEWYAAELAAHGLAPTWVGRGRHPAARVLALARALAGFRPHLVQAGHFFTNLYVAGAAATVGAVAVGGMREDPRFGMAQNGRWGPLLLRAPRAIVANSEAARREAVALGADPARLHVVANVLDVREFDRRAAPDPDPATVAWVSSAEEPCALAVGTMAPVKRFDRFLDALARARADGARVRGAIVGDGPERAALERRARDLGLLPDGVRFLGRRGDVPALLRRAAMLALTSDQEGCPNVVLEGMAAGLPVVTTPAGDAPVAVLDGRTGHVVPFDDVAGLAASLATLAADPARRAALGRAGRRRIEEHYAADGLAARLLATYRTIAGRTGHARLRRALAS